MPKPAAGVFDKYARGGSARELKMEEEGPTRPKVAGEQACSDDDFEEEGVRGRGRVRRKLQ
jgi:hypothetical protein